MNEIPWRETGNFSLCASFAAQRNGDARYALDLVSTTANLCEEKMRLLRYSKRCPACGKISRGINNQREVVRLSPNQEVLLECVYSKENGNADRGVP